MDIKMMYETFMRFKNKLSRQTFEADLSEELQKSATVDKDMGAEKWTSKR